MTAGALARAGLVVTGAFFISRVLGWLRVVVLGNVYGAGAELDAYYAAFRIPDLIYQLVAAGAIASALVPVLSGLLAEGQPARAWKVASTVANLMLLVLLVLSAVMLVMAPWLVPLLVPGFDAATTAETVQLTQVMLISPLFLALGAVASAALNSSGRFGAAAMAPVLYNVAIIGGALLLGPTLGVMGAAIGVVAGSVAHLVVQMPLVRRYAHYTRHVDLADPQARQALWLMVPRAIGLGASQVTFLVNTALATGLASGAVTAYNVAFSVLQIPMGVISVPIGVVLLPSMSRALALGQAREFGVLVVGSLRLLLWVSLFVAAVGIVLREPVTDLLFSWGFDASALERTAATLGVFLLGLPAHSLNVILARAFYSARDTATPVAVAVGSVVVNVAVSLATVDALGLLGLALGVALGGWFEAFILSVLLRRRTPAFTALPVVAGGLVSLGGALLAAAAAAAVLAGLQTVWREPVGALVLLAEVALAAATAGALYLLYSRAVRIPELPRALGLLRAGVRRG